jgi:hypothetical protein
MKRFISLSIVFALMQVFFIANSSAQITTFGKFLIADDEDAQLLLSNYLTPYMNGFGASMAGGWYYTAKPHKTGGFDINISASVALIPLEQRSFELNSDDLTYLNLAEGTSATCPTVAGTQDEGPKLMHDYSNLSDTAFAMPGGYGFPATPAPMIQASIGLIKGTEITGRYLPQIGFEETGKYSFWGCGIKHDLKQWIPGFKHVPIINLSLMAGYTQMNGYANMEVTEFDANLGGYNAGIDPAIWDNQRMIAKAHSFTTNLYASINIPVINIYGGVGMAYAKSMISFEGNYPYLVYDPAAPGAEPQLEAREIPYDIQVGIAGDAKWKPRLNAGLRFKVLKVMTFYVDYTKANYDVITAGLGFAFR